MKGVAILGLAALAVTSVRGADQGEFFETKVRPVLAKNCYACHTDSRMGGLRLDSAEGISKGGNSGPAVVPGNDDSLLLQAIRRTHQRIKMPPSGKLPDSDIAAIAEWVKNGAVWPAGAPAAVKVDAITAEQRAFWSFLPVRKPAVPKVKDAKWARTDIDRFVLARLEAQGLKPARPADRRILIRRATLDLTGLPPSPEEVDAFLADKAPDAFAKVVDRLLASPRYGERWGRLWLDVARYSDERLNSTDPDPIANAFRYRDWVIHAFNKDMPYDVFVKAQLAGDLMPSADPLEYRAGTGFYAMSPEMQDDRVDATSRGFLGLTVACAQCHYHKFDPIPQADFYSLQGVFSSSQTKQFPLAPKDVVEKWDAQKKALDKQEAALKEFTAAQSDQLAGILAAQTARYLLASRDLAPADDLDHETLDRWKKYLANPKKDHPYLKRWMELAARNASRDEMESAAQEFQAAVESVNEEKHTVDEHNKIRLGLNPDRNAMSQADLESLAIEKYNLWHAVLEGVDHYTGAKLDRFLNGEWKWRLLQLRQAAATLKKELPPQYPFLQSLQDASNPHDIRVAIRGDVNNRGDVAPRHLPSILCAGRSTGLQQRQRQAPAGGGNRQPGESVDRPRDGESHLAASFRARPGRDAEQFWKYGRAPQQSGVVGLPGGALCGIEVEHEGASSGNPAFGRLWPERGRSAGKSNGGRRQSPAVARQLAAHGRGDAARFTALRRRESGSARRRRTGRAERSEHAPHGLWLREPAQAGPLPCPL